MKEFITLPAERIGSSFDYRILVGEEPGPEDGVLEIKCVDAMSFDKTWEDIDGDVSAPLRIEIQHQTQLYVSGLKWGYIGALVGGNHVVLLRREADAQTHEAIGLLARKFWTSIDEGKVPQPNFEKDARVIKSLFSKAFAGKVMEGTGEMAALVREYKAHGDAASELEKKRDAIRAKILLAAEDCERITHPEFSINLGLVKECKVAEFVRKPYRNFRLTIKK